VLLDVPRIAAAFAKLRFAEIPREELESLMFASPLVFQKARGHCE
jgi:hypothetical protein